MATLKTKQNALSVDEFIDRAAADETVHKDCKTLIKLMKKVTGEPAKMWGTAIIGFGSYHYKYDSGHEGDMCLVGFSPRKANISLYVLLGAPGQDKLLPSLGKHKAGKGCLYIKRLADVDLSVLESLIRNAVAEMKKKYI